MYSFVELARAIQRALSICEMVISAAIFLLSIGCGPDSSTQPVVEGELQTAGQATLRYADNEALPDGYVNERRFG